jgi:hypothetical protein
MIGQYRILEGNLQTCFCALAQYILTVSANVTVNWKQARSNSDLHVTTLQTVSLTLTEIPPISVQSAIFIWESVTVAL